MASLIPAYQRAACSEERCCDLIEQVSIPRAAEYYGIALQLQRTTGEVRTRCFLNCGKAEETGDRAMAIDLDRKRFRCHHYGCTAGGGLLDLMYRMKHGNEPTGGKLRGEAFKDVVADLQAIAGGAEPLPVAEPSEMNPRACGNRHFPGAIFTATNGFLDEGMYDRDAWSYNGVMGKMISFNEKTIYLTQWLNQGSTWHDLIFDLARHQYGVRSVAREASKAPATPMRQRRGKRAPADIWQSQVPIRPAALALDERTGELLSRIELPAAPVWDGMATAEGVLFISKKDGSVSCYR